MYSHPVEPRDTFKSQNRRREEECDGGRGGEKEVYRLVKGGERTGEENEERGEKRN